MLKVLARLMGLRVAGCCLAFISSATLAAQEPNRVTLAATGIQLLGPSDVTTGLLEVRAAVSPYLLLIASPGVSHVREGDTAAQFRTSATLRLPLGSIRVEDRNQLIFSSVANTRYTQRLRLIQPFELWGQSLRLLVFDELSHEFHGRGWFRNTVAAGAGFAVGRVNADAYWAVQKDDHRPSASLVWIQVTTRLR